MGNGAWADSRREKKPRIAMPHGSQSQYFMVIGLVSWLSPLVAQMVKNSPEMRETWVRSLGWEGSLEEGMATHSSILT